MDELRVLARIAGLGLLVALLLPALAIGPASAVDRGPDGRPRASAFPIGLAAFDPAVRESARNSAILAGLVAGGSLALGVGLGHLIGARRFWGRWPLAALAKVPMAAGPLLIAPGVLLGLGGASGWDWLAARSVLGWSAEDLARWGALAWVGLCWGVPMVAMATESALRRVEPAWSEAARAAGASPGRAWRDATWPAIRPEAARAAATVFTLGLVEPAGPMVLGLDRTLAVGMIRAATRLDQPTRAATLAVLATLLAVAGRALFLRWGGPSRLRPGPDLAPPPAAAGRARALASAAILAAWAVAAAGPVALLLWRATDPERGANPGRWWGLLVGWLADPEARGWAINAAMVGLLAVGVDLLALAALAGRGPGGPRFPARLALWVFEAVPPLALAVGALALPWLLGALADRSGGAAGGWLRAAARELSPARWPGFLLIAAVAAGRLPTLARAAGLARARPSPALADAARAMGASRRRARRAGRVRWLGVVPARPAFLSLALASTALAPALLLAPGSERRTLAPAVLGGLLAPEAPGAGLLGPVAALLAAHLAGFALASRGRSGPLGDWYRG